MQLDDRLAPMLRRLLWLFRQVTERAAVRVGLGIITVALFSAFAIHVIEGNQNGENPNGPYSTFIGTCQQVAILLFSGFDVAEMPRHPVSVLLTFVCLFLGICLLALLTADLASVMISYSMHGKGRCKVGLKNHVLVCGWHYSAKAIVEQLTSREHKPRRKICVVDQEVEDLRLLSVDVDYVRGDPTLQESLDLACADQADVAIIPLDMSYSEELQDSRITLATMAVKSVNPNVYTCVELLHSINRRHIQRTGVDEVVCVGELSQTLLGMAALSHGASHLFEELLTFNQGNEIHRVPLPKLLAGRTFRWLLRELNERRDCVLVSVQRGKKVHTNPQQEFLLESGDQLFVIAESPPKNLETLV